MIEFVLMGQPLSESEITDFVSGPVRVVDISTVNYLLAIVALVLVRSIIGRIVRDKTK